MQTPIVVIYTDHKENLESEVIDFWKKITVLQKNRKRLALDAMLLSHIGPHHP